MDVGFAQGPIQSKVILGPGNHSGLLFQYYLKKLWNFWYLEYIYNWILIYLFVIKLILLKQYKILTITSTVSKKIEDISCKKTIYQILGAQNQGIPAQLTHDLIRPWNCTSTECFFTDYSENCFEFASEIIFWLSGG